jgi:hypothetical protein
MTELIFYPDYSGGNPYQKLLYQNAISKNELTIYSATLDVAISRAEMGIPTIFHQHWINAYFRDCKDLESAIRVATSLKYRFDKFKSLDGLIIWTIHNTVSHDFRFEAVDQMFRQYLGAVSDIIHLHDPSHFHRLSCFSLDPSKVIVCPHPSYLGYYGPFSIEHRIKLLDSRHNCKRVAFIGAIRANKSPMMIVNSAKMLASQGFQVTIAGKPENESVAEIIVSQLDGLGNVDLIMRRLHEKEIHELCLNNNFGLVSYAEILTSGTIELYNSYGMIVFDCAAIAGNRPALNANQSSIEKVLLKGIVTEHAKEIAISNYMHSLSRASLSFPSQFLMDRLYASC